MILENITLTSEMWKIIQILENTSPIPKKMEKYESHFPKYGAKNDAGRGYINTTMLKLHPISWFSQG